MPPPLALARVRLTGDGKVACSFCKPWKNGSEGVRLDPDIPGTAELTVAFPKPMKSVVFCYQSSYVAEQSKVDLDYTVGSGWVPLPDCRRGRTEFVVEQVLIPATGVTSFTLRARMTVRQITVQFGTVHFLGSFIDQFGELDVTCFAIFADPDPDVARVPR